MTYFPKELRPPENSEKSQKVSLEKYKRFAVD